MFSTYVLPMKNPNTMSKRSMQVRKPREEPVLAKSKPVILVLSVNQPPMLDSGTSCSPGNYGKSWNPNLISTEKARRNKNENSAPSSEVYRNENPRPSTEKSGRDVNQRSSTKKSCREEQNRLTETKLTHHNLQIFNRPYLEKVFANVRQKLSRPQDDQMLDLNVNVLTWGLFVSDNGSCNSPRRELRKQPVHLKEHRLRRIPDVVRHHAETDLGPETRDQTSIYD